MEKILTIYSRRRLFEIQYSKDGKKENDSFSSS